jgi:hypothetical protein
MSERKTEVPLGPGRSPSLSPDGRWIAYASNESGRDEVYVQSTSGGAGKRLISTAGRVEPLWSPRGEELFYRHGENLFAVAISTQGRFEHGTPRLLFQGPSVCARRARQPRLRRDGRRFVMIKKEVEPVTGHLKVVVHWQEELKRLVPVRRATRHRTT